MLWVLSSYTPYSTEFLRFGRGRSQPWDTIMRCFEHFEPSKVKHGKGNLINCIAQPLVRTDNVIIEPTKVHFGEWISIDQTPSYCCKFKLTLFGNYWWSILMAWFLFHFRTHQGSPLECDAHTRYCVFVQRRVSRRLRLIFGGRIINYCHVVYALKCLRMMLIMRARVCIWPLHGRVSMCMTRWKHSHDIRTCGKNT